MRELSDSMKLEDLFNQDENFMNEDLRDFLNTSDTGLDYTLDDMQGDGWNERDVSAAKEHQTTANPNHPNRKFVNDKDGREAVFDAKGNFIKDGIDAGTYNYGMPFGFLLGTSHGQYDMKPFFRQHGTQPSYWKMRVGTNYGFNSK